MRCMGDLFLLLSCESVSMSTTPRNLDLYVWRCSIPLPSPLPPWGNTASDLQTPFIYSKCLLVFLSERQLNMCFNWVSPCRNFSAGTTDGRPACTDDVVADICVALLQMLFVFLPSGMAFRTNLLSVSSVGFGFLSSRCETTPEQGPHVLPCSCVLALDRSERRPVTKPPAVWQWDHSCEGSSKWFALNSSWRMLLLSCFAS